MITRIPLRKALFQIALSTFLVSGTAFLAFLFYQYVRSLRLQDSKYRIVAIVQRHPAGTDGLKTVYLAELLRLSIDRPENLYRFNNKQARRNLLNCPVIKEAKVKKIPPGTVFIDYLVRTPIALLSDYTNTVVDQDRFPFPYKPFFAPKKLPEICLGFDRDLDVSPLEGGLWGQTIKGGRVELAYTLLDYLTNQYLPPSSRLIRLDVSNAFSPSLGRREIVAIIEEGRMKEIQGRQILYLFSHALRLPLKNYEIALENYITLRDKWLFQDSLFPLSSDSNQKVVKVPMITIDLRLPNLAFLKRDD